MKIHGLGLRQLPSLACTAIAVGLLGCDGKESADSTPDAASSAAVAPLAALLSSPAEKAADARRQVVRWLECEECIDGELAAVAALGESVVPTLALTLRDGPSLASREALRLQLIDTYTSLQAYAANKPGRKVDGSSEGFVQEYLDTYESTYRVRSAQALAAIGGVDARDALRAFVGQMTAAGLPARPEVQAAVDAALNQLANTTPTGP